MSQWLSSFIKYNIVALVATSVDFIVFIFLNDIVNLWYIVASIISVTAGGVTAFLLNRNWVFKSKKQIKRQAIQYTLVWVVSLLLNTIGLYLMVENTNISEVLSKLIVAGFVGISYNYLMSKHIVFK